MGSFNVPCALTGIATNYGMPVVVLAVARRLKGRAYSLVAPPLSGHYDDYGLVNVYDLDTEIMGRSKLQWWQDANLGEAFEGDKVVQTTYYSRKPKSKVPALYQERQPYEDIEIWVVLQAIWALKNTFKFGYYNDKTYDYNSLLASKEFLNFVNEELNTFMQLKDIDDPKKMADYVMDLLLGDTGHPLNTCSLMRASECPIASMLAELRTKASSPLPMQFISASPIFDMMMDYYSKNAKTVTDRTQLLGFIQSLLHMVIDCVTFEYYMEASGVSLCQRPIVSQTASDSWEQQARFYESVAMVLDDLLDDEEDEMILEDAIPEHW